MVVILAGYVYYIDLFRGFEKKSISQDASAVVKLMKAEERNGNGKRRGKQHGMTSHKDDIPNDIRPHDSK